MMTARMTRELSWNSPAQVIPPREMRRLVLPGTLLLLLAATGLLWQFRFECVPGIPRLQPAASLSPGATWEGETLRLKVSPAEPGPVVARLDFPGTQPVDFLHLRFNFAAKDLLPGPKLWQDGRLILEWQPPGGGAHQDSPMSTVRHRLGGGVEEWVTHPDGPAAIPSLRVEHLGVGGEVELKDLQVSVVRERLSWKLGRWLLLGAWFVWLVGWIGLHAGLPRTFAAAAIWLLVGVHFVVPGPWHSYKSLVQPFQIGTAAAAGQRPPDPLKIAPVAAGELPEQGALTLRLKHLVSGARPFLHIALLFGPTLLCACLVGRQPAGSLGVLFSLAIEGAQLAFGYGFDAVDVFDLVCDATGIALALFVHHRLMRIAHASAAAGKIRAAVSAWCGSGGRKTRGAA